jgi:hypothetical protein
MFSRDFKLMLAGGALGIIAGWMICLILLSVFGVEEKHCPPQKPCVQDIKLSEYKSIVRSLDLCNQNERAITEDWEGAHYTWDRIMMLDRYIKDAPDDYDRMRANDLCEECEERCEQELWDYKSEHEGECWCPYGPESDGPYDLTDLCAFLDTQDRR